VIDVEQLVKKSRDGDESAFAELIKVFQGKVFSIAYGILMNKAEAEDTAQDAFIKAYFSLKKLKKPAAFPSWLFKITAHLALNKTQRCHCMDVSLDDGTDMNAQLLHQTGDNPEDAFMRYETQDLIKRALASLPAKYRAAIALREIEGFSYAEIADILQIPEGTAKSRVHEARHMFKDRLIALGWEIKPYDEEG